MINQIIPGVSSNSNNNASAASFGESKVSNLSPIVQIDAIYGIQRSVETFSFSTGVVEEVNGNFRCRTGTGLFGYGVIRSKRAVRCRPGQSATFRFTAKFDPTNAAPSSLQAAGPFNSTNGFLVGYNGMQFGIMHRTKGQHELRRLVISASASGNETLTLTLNNTPYVIPLTSGTAQHNAAQIETWMKANQGSWDVFQVDNTVIFFNLNVGPASGTYSASSTGNFAGTISQLAAGLVNEENWVYQNDFSHDKLDGNGTSKMVLDHSKGNAFEISTEYLGFNAVVCKILDPKTGRFFTFHQFEFTNSRDEPVLSNPTLKVGWIAANLGSTSPIIVEGAVASGGIDGKISPIYNPVSHSHSRSSVGSSLTSIFAIRVRSVFGNKVHLGEVLPKLMTVSPGGSKAIEVKILLNPTFTSTRNWMYKDEVNSVVEIDIAGGIIVSPGRELTTRTVAQNSSGDVVFNNLAGEGNPIFLQRGDVLAIAARVTGGSSSDITASLTWLEEQPPLSYPDPTSTISTIITIRSPIMNHKKYAIIRLKPRSWIQDLWVRILLLVLPCIGFPIEENDVGGHEEFFVLRKKDENGANAISAYVASAVINSANEDSLAMWDMVDRWHEYGYKKRPD